MITINKTAEELYSMLDRLEMIGGRDAMQLHAKIEKEIKRRIENEVDG